MSTDRTLIHLAASVLEKGPMHTVALAHEALGLTGNPGAASDCLGAMDYAGLP